MNADKRDTFVIGSDDRLMPKIGVGTYQMRDKDVLFAVIDAALASGYRLIDTAAVYQNEAYIGDILDVLLPKYALTRSDVFITSKLAPKDQGYESAQAALRRSLERLRLDYLDLYLIHWPGASKTSPSSVTNSNLRRDSWRALEKMKGEGLVREIGVSNYTVAHLQELASYATVRPAVNQCEFHPHYAGARLLSHCATNGIHLQAYSSFGSPAHKQALFSDPAIVDLARRMHCSVAQLLLAWALCQGVSVLPRSTNPEHVKSNINSLGIRLTDKDVSTVVSSTMRKYCWDPTAIV